MNLEINIIKMLQKIRKREKMVKKYKMLMRL